MKLGKEVHWFVNSACNLACPGCFRDMTAPKPKEYSLETLAEKLVDLNANRVTIGGGEPTLIRTLHQPLSILHNAGIETRLHTNGMFLREQWEKLAPHVKYIALPVDSLDESVQGIIRGTAFLPALRSMGNLAKMIKDSRVQLGCHTFFTALNDTHVEELYEFLSYNQFDSWKIFEFNERIPREKYYEKLLHVGESASPEIIQRLKKEDEEITLLAGNYDTLNGGVNSLSARFLRAEHMYAHRKSAPQTTFVGVRDIRQPYAFLYNTGAIHGFTWFSNTNRRPLGNIMQENYPEILQKLSDLEQPQFEEESGREFDEAESNTPLWMRLAEGSYFDEEFEELPKKVQREIVSLSNLYETRKERLWEAYKNKILT